MSKSEIVSPRQALVRSAYYPRLFTDDVLAFLFSRSSHPVWMDAGGHKDVIDLGDNTVARVYECLDSPGEDWNDPMRTSVPEEAVPYERRLFGRVRVEIVPKLLPGTDREVDHLQAILLERGLVDLDPKRFNIGIAPVGVAHIKIMDGAVQRRPDDVVLASARLYIATDAEGSEFPVAVIGKWNTPDRCSFRGIVTSTGVDFHPDPSLQAAFVDTPWATGLWLRPYPEYGQPQGWPANYKVDLPRGRSGPYIQHLPPPKWVQRVPDLGI